MKVKDVMHKGVDWGSPNTPVTEVAKLMREHDGPSVKRGARGGRQAARSDLETRRGRRRMHPNMGRDLAPPHSITSPAGANGTGGAVMFGGNASGRCGRSDRIQPSTMARSPWM